MTLSRRELLKRSALTGAGLALTPAFLNGMALPAGAARAKTNGWGALVPDPAGLLDLPAGFSYEVLAKGGNGYPTGFTTYDDGTKCPR